MSLRQSSSDVSETAMAAMPSSVQQMIQGPMLLSAALPHHGTPPNQKELDEMADAGQLLYKAHTILQNADESLGAAHEQLKLQQTGTKPSSNMASSIMDAEKMIQTGKARLEQGENLARQARDSFYNNANPLGDPPEAPHEWDNVKAMGDRARAKLVSLNEHLKDTKRLARQQGVSLSDITVAQETAVVLQDAYGAKKDSEILDFLNGY